MNKSNLVPSSLALGGRQDEKPWKRGWNKRRTEAAYGVPLKLSFPSAALWPCPLGEALPASSP